MFDENYKYCPVCLDEYRREIESCAACGTALKSGEQMLLAHQQQRDLASERKGAIQAGDELVVVRRGPLAELKVYEKLLAGQNIGTLLAGDEASCGKGCCPGNFDLLVRRVDGPAAILVIENEIRRTAVIDHQRTGENDGGFDPLAAENTCPACGHRFSGGLECPDCGLCF